MKIDYDNPISVAEALKEYQLYRKGKGKYKWHEAPERNEPMPFTCEELTKIEDAAIKFLSRLA